VGTESGGLNRLNQQTGVFESYHHSTSDPINPSDDWVLSLFEDKERNLWIGTRNGLDKLDPSRRHNTHYRRNPGNRFSLSDNWINCIHEDRSGELWIGTNDGGVNKFLPARDGFQSYLHNPDDEWSLAANRILAIFEDHSGNLWFGRNRFNKNVTKFKLYQQLQNNPNSLSNNRVRNILKEGQDILWVATDGGGLDLINRVTDHYTHFLNNPFDPGSLSSNHVFSLLRDREGILWITTVHGLNRFDPQRGKFFRYVNNPADSQSLSHDFIRTIIEDPRNFLWLGTDGGVLNRFDKKSGLFKRFLPPSPNPDSPSFYSIVALLQDQSGIFWIGTYGGGLKRFDPVTERFKTYRYDSLKPDSLKDDYVMSLLEDSRGWLWVGTSSGLARFDRESESFLTYTEKQGLPDRVIYAIVEDTQGNLWLSSNRGLSRFNPVTQKIKNFDIHDGLQDYEFNTYSAYRGEDGELFFGGIHGFNSFYPEEITDNPHIPPIVLTGFQLSGREVPVDTPIAGRAILSRSITETEEIRLSYIQNAISFEFAALDFLAPEKNLYSYIMEGLEREWSPESNRRFISYAGLPPGNYTFRVKGSNNDKIWNEKGTAVKIIIRPPFWQTGWFYFLVAATLVGGAFGAHKRRIRSLEEKKKELEKLVDLKTRELKESSLIDPLTGLRNRRFISDVLSSDLIAFIKYKNYLLDNKLNRRREKTDLVFGLFILDIDHFKKVNDAYGHEAGDRLLVQLGKVFQSSVRQDDSIIRFGGEEFLVILKKTDPTYLNIFAEKIRKKVETTPFSISDEGKVIHKTCSIGYAAFPFYEEQPDLMSFEKTLQLADMGLLFAKKNGRNLAVRVNPTANIPRTDQLDQFILSLPYALKNQLLTLTLTAKGDARESPPRA